MPTSSILKPLMHRKVVACALYRNGRRGAISRSKKWVPGRPRRRHRMAGLHEPDDVLLGLLKSQLGLHELMIQDANQAHQRPKLDVYDKRCSSFCGRPS